MGMVLVGIMAAVSFFFFFAKIARRKCLCVMSKQMSWNAHDVKCV